MGKLARAVLLTIATVAGALAPAYGQSTLPNNPPPPTTIIDRGTPLTPLGWFVIGSVGCAAVSPMIATVILGRELTFNEAYRLTFGCFLGPIGWLVTILHVPGPLYNSGNWHVQIGYVLIPWMGVMAAGYAFGSVFSWPVELRRRSTLALGIALTLAFVIVRGINLYGNPRPWVAQDTLLKTVFAFIDCHKYPPSLDYVLMTIGPALILLSIFEKGTPKLLRPAIVFGRVPLFYYLLHLPLLHGMAVLVAFIRHGRADWLYVSPFSGAQPPANAGFGLLGVYIFWISAIILLYPICKWFSELKLRRRDWWLSYL